MWARRIRLGRLLPVVLRQTVGNSYAIETHREPPTPLYPEEVVSGALVLEYDDGNGMWISPRVAP